MAEIIGRKGNAQEDPMDLVRTLMAMGDRTRAAAANRLRSAGKPANPAQIEDELARSCSLGIGLRGGK